MKSIGVPANHKYITKCNRDIACVGRLIDEIIDNKSSFSAIITSVDTLAIGVIKALVHQGIKVPEDVSEIGFNNSILADFSTPTITSTDNKVEILCTDAVRTLLDVFENKNVSRVKTIQSEMIYRESFPK